MTDELITIEPYNPAWQDEFRTIGEVLRKALGDLALRIDHIGSTAVPGLGAKDRIDIQITVKSLEPAVELALNQVGYTRIKYLTGDHIPPGYAGGEGDWVKWVFEPPTDQRPTNVHIRMNGKPNQRYALLFRDYLRAHPDIAEAYYRVKKALAHYYAEDKDAYYDVKDPVFDIIMGGAELWAAGTNWHIGPTDV
jgi:GrpB-like predicted nucleotidyltransferase (UPF0157 family)